MRSIPRFIKQICSDFQDYNMSTLQVLIRLNSLWVAATYPFGDKGRNLSIHYASEISRCIAPQIRLGNRAEIRKRAWLNTWLNLGTEDPCALKITIEDDCRIGERCTISAKNSIHLERGVVLASDVLVIDHNHAYEDATRPIRLQGVTPGGRIRIGEACRIGEGAAIIGTRGELILGRNCVVAPRAVVTRSFPPNSVISGNPASCLKH